MFHSPVKVLGYKPVEQEKECEKKDKDSRQHCSQVPWGCSCWPELKTAYLHRLLHPSGVKEKDCAEMFTAGFSLVLLLRVLVYISFYTWSAIIVFLPYRLTNNHVTRSRGHSSDPGLAHRSKPWTSFGSRSSTSQQNLYFSRGINLF